MTNNRTFVRFALPTSHCPSADDEAGSILGSLDPLPQLYPGRAGRTTVAEAGVPELALGARTEGGVA